MEAFVLNENFEVVSVLDSYSSFIWTDRFRVCGDFEYVASANDINSLSVERDNFLTISESDYWMIVETISVNSDAEDGDQITISGRSLESALDRRIVWKQQSHDGLIQNGIKELLNDNAINPADPKRILFPDGNGGSLLVFKESDDPYISTVTGTFQFTGDNLYEAICSLCASLDIGFYIIPDGAGHLEFGLYSGVDRSFYQEERSYVVFSPDFDNIITNEYMESSINYKNITLIGGEGEGEDRVYTTYGDEEAEGMRRREYFTDARDISSQYSDRVISDSEYKEMLKQRGKENLAECTLDKVFEGEVEATRLFVYGRDFFLGDIVQTVNNIGMASRSRVVEMIRSQDRNGLSMYPAFEVVIDEEEEA